MRIHLLLASLATLAAATAHAQPAVTESIPAPQTQSTDPNTYVQLDALAGVQLLDSSWAAGAVEAGYRLGNGPLWVHGMAGAGNAEVTHGFFDSTPPDRGSFKMARVGLELRGYLDGTNGILGGMIGFDVGGHQIQTDMETVGGGEGVLRGGLDIGGRNVRARATMGVSTEAAVEVTGGLAYQF